MIRLLRWVQNIFWNGHERRLRAGWRLSLQTVLLIFVVSASTGLLLDLLGLNPTLADSGLLVEAAGLLSQFVAILSSMAVAGWLLDHRPVADFGLHLNREWWADLGFGLLLGALLMCLIFGLEWAAGWVVVTDILYKAETVPSFGVGLAGALAVFLIVGIQEELWTRGYQLRNLSEGLNFTFWGPRGAVLAAWLGSSLVFGLLHAGNPNATLISTINLTLAGLFLGLGYILTGELAIPIGLHITWNFFQGNVFGFPVSGLDVNHVTFIAVKQAGPSLWTGGAFGPEAGLMGIAAILVGSGLILGWIRLRRGEIRLWTGLASYQVRPVTNFLNKG